MKDEFIIYLYKQKVGLILDPGNEIVSILEPLYPGIGGF